VDEVAVVLGGDEGLREVLEEELEKRGEVVRVQELREVSAALLQLRAETRGGRDEEATRRKRGGGDEEEEDAEGRGEGGKEKGRVTQRQAATEQMSIARTEEERSGRREQQVPRCGLAQRGGGRRPS
jgi:hypothetical protein